jgi:ubiquinone/menaquinone biosynthesis C-methylase UbiE
MDQPEIYAKHAGAYDELVRAEDRDGNLLPAIERICPLDGAKVIEVGVGTGRIARQILPRLASYLGVDREEAMLEVARQHLSALEQRGVLAEGAQWQLLRCDARELPVASGWAHLAIAGWVFGHFREWMPERWRDEVAQAIAELRRILRVGGTVLLIETLGTGSEEPAPPTPGLAEYYGWLEAQGFVRESIRTDYLFDSVDEAARITGFFFGEDFAARVRRERWTRIPECTGLWYLRHLG